MAGEKRRTHRAEQHARAQGAGHVEQFAGDQYNIISTGTGPVPQATAALPAPPAHLVGRTSEAEQLLELLDPEGQGPSAVVVSAVSGLAGIGKTALALHVAHEAAIVRNWYPGGVLFVNLRGYDPEGQVTGGQALAALLRALGVRDKDLPSTTDEQAAVYRSELARLNGRAGEPPDPRASRTPVGGDLSGHPRGPPRAPARPLRTGARPGPGTHQRQPHPRAPRRRPSFARA
jgi:hypothetical protein